MAGKKAKKVRGNRLKKRIRIGFALGWQYYAEDAEHDWSEITFFLGLISIVIKY